MGKEKKFEILNYDELPKNINKSIAWHKMENGYILKTFHHKYGFNEIKFICYNKENQTMIVEYEHNQHEIRTCHFLQGKLGRVLGYRTSLFKIDIGETIEDFNRSMKITDCKKEGILKWYKYTCNVCKWTNGLIEESNLMKGVGCSCCANRTIVLGINTIWDTHKWLVDEFGLDEEFAKSHTYGTKEKGSFVCKTCGKTKTTQVYSVVRLKSIGCICGDGFSYPEKFMYNVLKQIGTKFDTQYSPKYLNRKYSDFYLPEYDLIIETDGILGHHGGRVHSKSNKSLEYDVEIDNWKDEQHKLHGIETIRINCFESDIEYIKNNILESNLNKLFDLSVIDFAKADEYALKSNKIKEVCDYWNDKKELDTTYNASVEFNVAKTTIIEYLKRGAKLGWCEYNPKEEMRKCGVKSGKLFMKRVKMYKGKEVMGFFESAAELERQSEELFGIKLNFGNISSVCRGCTSQYKGYRFEYIPEEEYLNSQSLKKVV